MADVFLEQIRRERLHAAGWLVVLLIFLAVLAFGLSRMLNPEGRLVEGQVERFGTRATDIGDLPVVTVRLPDGSIRQVETSRALVKGCSRGDRIELVQRGTALRVGIRACNS
jgi:hypothetical protein